jgi:hypothetical protein
MAPASSPVDVLPFCTFAANSKSEESVEFDDVVVFEDPVVDPVDKVEEAVVVEVEFKESLPVEVEFVNGGLAVPEPPPLPFPPLPPLPPLPPRPPRPPRPPSVVLVEEVVEAEVVVVDAAVVVVEMLLSDPEDPESPPVDPESPDPDDPEPEPVNPVFPDPEAGSTAPAVPEPEEPEPEATPLSFPVPPELELFEPNPPFPPFPPFLPPAFPVGRVLQLRVEVVLTNGADVRTALEDAAAETAVPRDVEIEETAAAVAESVTFPMT